MYAPRSHTAPYAVAVLVCTQVYNTGYIALLLRRAASPSGVFSQEGGGGGCSFGAEHTTMVHTARKDAAAINIQSRGERPLEPRLLSVHLALRSV